MSRHPNIKRKTIAKQILCFKNQINISEKASRQPDIRHRTRCRTNIVLQKSNWYKFCPTMWWFIGGDNHPFSPDQSSVPKSWMKVDNKQTLAQTSDWKLNAWMVQLGLGMSPDWLLMIDKQEYFKIQSFLTDQLYQHKLKFGVDWWLVMDKIEEC